MYASQESLVALNKAQIDALQSAALIGVDTVQRVAGLNAAAAASFTREALSAAQALGAGRLPGASSPLTDLFSSYPRQLLEIFQAAQGEMLKLMDSGMGQLSREALESAEKSLVHNVFPGGEWMATGIRNALGATVSSVDALQLMFKQLTEVSEATLKAATPVPAAAAPLGAAPRKRAA